MPRWLQIILHVAMASAGAYAAYATGTPLPLVVTSGLQTVTAGIGQAYNTDGTPQETPFVKPTTK